MNRSGDAEASDIELIRRFLANRDAWAFGTLYQRHSPAVHGLLCRLTGGHESDAADLLQDAWIRVADKLPGFRGASQFRTWLTGIVLNCYREWRRAAMAGCPAGSVAMDDPETIDIGPATPADSRGLDIDQVLQALPTHYRDVLVLHDVEGFTHEDIATALGIEPGTSKSRLTRARRLFRAWWREGISR